MLYHVILYYIILYYIILITCKLAVMHKNILLLQYINVLLRDKKNPSTYLPTHLH